MAGQTNDRDARSRAPFDPRPAQVEDWVASLPLANLGESSRLLFNALKETNERELPAEQRFRMLELIGPPLQTVAASLSRHFVGKSVPLNDKSRQIFQLAQTLMNLMAAGYRRVVEDSGEKRALLRDNRQVVTAIHRALDYLGQGLLRTYQAYAPYPPGVWQRAHRLYQFAEAQGMAQMPVKDAVGTLTVEDAYKRILLLALACPYRLRQGEVEQVYHWLGAWARHATLSTLLETAGPNSLFVTHLEGDDPPTYRVLRQTEHANDACRLLNASHLADAMRSVLAPSDAQQRSAQPVNEQVLRRLMLAWGVLPKRRFTRTQKHSTAMVAMGLSTAHYFIGGETAFEASCAATGEPLFNKPARFEAAETAGQRELPDVWALSDIHTQQPEAKRDAAGNAYLDFVVPEPPRQPQIVPMERPAAAIAFRAHEWKMINVSAGGYRLLWDKTDDSQAQVGELLGLRESSEPDGFHLSLGVVRWMKQSTELGVELGVEMLSPGAVAVGTKLHRLGGDSEYMRSLLLPAIKAVGQPATLLTPALPYHVGNIVMVNSHGKEARVELTKLVENTGTFAQFQFRPLDSQATSTETARDADKSDEFAALWTQI